MFPECIIKLSRLLILFLLAGCSGNNTDPRGDGDLAGTLKVAIGNDIPAVVEVHGNNAALHYEMLKAYAADVGTEIELIPVANSSAGKKLVRDGHADMVLLNVGSPSTGTDSHQLYSTSYVLLAGYGTRPVLDGEGDLSLGATLAGKRVMVRSDFRQTDSWMLFMQELKGSDVFVSDEHSADLALRIPGHFDVLVCEMSEARLISSLYHTTRIIHEFPDRVGIEVYAAGGHKGLREDFADWLGYYRSTNEYTALTYLYLEQGSAELAGRFSPAPGSGDISVYDRLMKDICDREGFDWRLLSAIAYNESRFRPDVVSPRGARGLMQIMPSVARQFGHEPDHVMNPSVNITVAAALLKRIEKMLNIPAGTSYHDRMSLILACYNGGIGHVSDARRLAQKNGYDKNCWAHVSRFLKMKSLPEYHEDEVVRCGAFNGSGQTLAFVSDVMSRYSHYCSVAER